MKVLVADDEQITRVTLKKLLTKRGYEVELAKDGTEAYELLCRPDAPTIAILDWMMPGIDGMELCRRIRASTTGGYTYIIMLTAQREKEDFKAGMEAGADDYVSKPFDVDELHLRLRAAKRIVNVQEKLRAEARIDLLTNTLNRGAVDGVLDRALVDGLRLKEPVAVVLADVDGFKQVNDTYGHPVGDAILQHVAESLRVALRPYDALGRYGGEEFVVVAPHCDTDDAFDLAERLRLSVQDRVFRTDSETIVVTVSIGVATGFGGELTGAELVLLADSALYSAKRNGRNRTELADARPAVFRPASS